MLNTEIHGWGLSMWWQTELDPCYPNHVPWNMSPETKFEKDCSYSPPLEIHKAHQHIKGSDKSCRVEIQHFSDLFDHRIQIT